MSTTFKFGLGGIGDNVQLGKNGPRIKVAPSGIQIRNKDDNDLINMQIAQGVNPDDAVNKQQMETAIAASQSPEALEYRGVFDASVGNYIALENGQKGDFYKVTVAGTIDASGTKTWDVGDNLILNKNVSGTPLDEDVDKIDNTESADILRTGDISNNPDFSVDGTKIADRTTIAQYVESQAGAGDRGANISFGTTSPVNIGDTVKSGTKVKRAYISVTQAFNGTTESTLQIGVAGNTGVIADISEIDLHTVGEYEIVCNEPITSETQLIATYVADGATEGTAEIVVEMVKV